MFINHKDRIFVHNVPASPQQKIIHYPGLYQFNSIIKPSGAQCNIDCEYCFYLDKQDLLNQPKYPRMDASILELHIRQYIEAQTSSEVVFNWQGGEPTLMGLDFFKYIVQLQKKYKKPDQKILNDLQTNGLLINSEWCRFLKENNFMVSISIDGPASLHDIYRRTKNDKPTHHLVIKAIEQLRHYSIEFNALCTVNKVNSQYPIKVYQYLRDEIRPKMIKFSAGIEVTHSKFNVDDPQNLNTSIKSVNDWSVRSSSWGSFLITIWQEWLKKDYGNVLVDQFENVISQLLGFGAQKCTTSQVCGKAVTVEFNGDVYSCDHFVYPEYKLGNIREIHEGDLVFSKKQEKFAYDKFKTLPKYCQHCEYLQLCWGECPKNRLIKAPDGEAGLNYLCTGLKLFYRQVMQDQEVLMMHLNNNKTV